MSWRFAIAAAGISAGCAEAGNPNQEPLDAPTTADAARRTDAAQSIDAPAAACATSATCATATTLAGIGGDQTGASSSSAAGYQAAWYSIRLSETDTGPFGDPMSIQTTLTSPSGAMFDLLVYVDTSSDQLDCAAPTGTVMTNGASETSNIKWGETGTFANGTDDSRTVSIQISPHGGASCSPNQMWSLSIRSGVD
jgi:hypothetical protein